jgi:hypothetical protein
MRRTNPIPGSGGRCRAGTPNPPRGQMRKTNPIWPGRRHLMEEIVQNEAKSEVSSFKFEVSSAGSERSGRTYSDCKLHTSHFKLPALRPGGRGCVQNEPNSSIADWGQTCGRAVALRPAASDPPRRLCKTNPISGARDTPLFHYSIIPVFQAYGFCAKQDGHDKSRSQANRSSIAAQKSWSQPDLGTFVVGVKQTQFAGVAMGGKCRQEKGLYGIGAGNRRCKTKPICGLRAGVGEWVSATVCPGVADIGPQGNRIVDMDFAFGVPRLRGSDWSFPPEGGTPNLPHQAGGAHAIAPHRAPAAIALSLAGR